MNKRISVISISFLVLLLLAAFSIFPITASAQQEEKQTEEAEEQTEEGTFIVEQQPQELSRLSPAYIQAAQLKNRLYRDGILILILIILIYIIHRYGIKRKNLPEEKKKIEKKGHSEFFK